MTIKFYLFYICVLLHCSIHSDGTASNEGSWNSMRRKLNKWTTEQEKRLIFFDVLTDNKRKDKLERVRALWHNEYPNSNVTDAALNQKLFELRKNSQEEGERARYFKWDHEKKTELLTIYYNTKPYKTDAVRSLEEEWGQHYKDFPFPKGTLLQQVRRILEQRGRKPEDLVKEAPDVLIVVDKPLNNSEFTSLFAVDEGYKCFVPLTETSNTDLVWDKQQDSDLIHVHDVAHSEGQFNKKYIHRIWASLHPEYSHVTLDQLRERINHLKNNPPGSDFPWQEEESKELLDIYDKTMPDEENQGDRIYDIWSKIHPRYKFMTPYYLQIHASTLAHKRELAGAGGSKKRRWTHGEKAYLLDLYHQHLQERDKGLEFHKGWVRKYPKLAYIPNRSLKTYALLLEKRGFNDTSGKLGEESSGLKASESGQQEKQKRHWRYGETPTKNRGKSKRLMKLSEREHETETPMKFRSVNELMTDSEGGISEKRFGKAKVVYHSDDQECSPSNMSEDSE